MAPDPAMATSMPVSSELQPDDYNMRQSSVCVAVERYHLQLEVKTEVWSLEGQMTAAVLDMGISHSHIGVLRFTL